MASIMVIYPKYFWVVASSCILITHAIFNNFRLIDTCPFFHT
jgi:hypothetical protein